MDLNTFAGLLLTIALIVSVVYVAVSRPTIRRRPRRDE